jgi:hypothetical protein
MTRLRELLPFHSPPEMNSRDYLLACRRVNHEVQKPRALILRRAIGHVTEEARH